ncbi:MAG TPA: ATP-binding protein [Gammaproteobacteria bacterium]|nr:ATP-binding protein [Gammaproteobacteria bacterium]
MTTARSGSEVAARARHNAAASLDFLPDDSEAARLIRDFDWAATPLGPPDGWSASLRMIVRFLLANRFPLLLWWGPDNVQIYNDAYAPILGTKHPREAMGKPLRECWHEVYDVLRPLVDTPFNGGPATWMEDLELIVKRHGFPEESHFTIAYSPVPDETAPRGIGGVLATVHEITDKVIGERRVKILRELGARLAAAKTDAVACETAATIFAQHPKDVPFALLYLLDESRRELALVCSTGIDAAVAGPPALAIGGPMSEVPWPLPAALASETLQTREGLAALMPAVPAGPWPHPPSSVAVVPIKSNVPGRPAGALVMGISSCIRLDALYTSFLELVGSQIATAVANARAYEEERRRAEALAEIDRAKTTFFSNVSHEFRTPLTLMLGPLEDALASMPASSPAHGHVALAQRNAQRLLKLVNSLLDFARIEAGRVRASYAPVDLAALTADLSSTFRSAMERAGLAFEVDCAPLGEPAHVDREMWEKIVLNLLSNAFKFTMQGSVRVRVARDGANALLEVADTGAGVPEHELPRLFERFHRVEGAESRTHEGSGIGLALVQELVKLHRGSIEVESTEGRGTVFRVRVPFGTAHLPTDRVKPAAPLASTAVAAHAYVQEALRWLPDEEDDDCGKVTGVPAVPEAHSAKRDRRFATTFNSRVLLADDNADMRAYVRDLLGPLYRVETVVDGESALEAARRERPDLILTDVMMPRLDGFGLLDALRADTGLRDVPVILLSARAGEESRIEGLGAGADDYVVKPFNARELLARVGALLELTRTRRVGEAQFRAFVQSTSDVVYRMAPDWSEMRYLRGRDFIADQEDPSRGWLQKYIPPADQPQVLAAIEQAIREKKRLELEHRVIRTDGTLGWTVSRAVPLFDEDGEIAEWFGAATDVTERRETQEALKRQRLALEEADRQKNEFLAMLAHELRNPLAPIRNSGELLARRFADDPQARTALATVERQVTHLTRLVDDLLDVSRITQGRIELRRKHVQLADVVARAVETVDPMIRQKRHKIAIVSSRKPLHVNADPERLVQCVANVLTNAAKYTDAGGEIRIESREENGEAVVAVTDDGIGIAPELLPKVFELFVQGDRALDRSQGGLGVGLAIVKRLIDMHGGSVQAQSSGAGRGATFEIRLPLVDSARPATVAARLRAGPKRKILVVDDNEDAANTLASLLALDGHDVETAYSGTQALDRVRAFRPGVVLLDIGLPGIDGYEVARRIRAEHANDGARLIAITGYGQDTDRERVRAAGFAGHLIKPVEFSVLQRELAAEAS